jgi:hypothetical protein
LIHLKILDFMNANPLLSWFNSFITQKYQYITNTNSISVISDVPQGYNVS